MKQFFLTIGCIISIGAIAQNIKPVVSLSTGYVTDKYAHFSMYGGGETNREDKQWNYFLEAGGKFQLTNDKVTDVAGINAGIIYTKYNFFTAIKVGPAMGFNRMVKDEYKTDTGIILLSPGYDKSYFMTGTIGLQSGYISGGVPMFIDVTYSGKLLWVGIGVKVLFNE